jgi:hypothetical protein
MIYELAKVLFLRQDIPFEILKLHIYLKSYVFSCWPQIAYQCTPSPDFCLNYTVLEKRNILSLIATENFIFRDMIRCSPIRELALSLIKNKLFIPIFGYGVFGKRVLTLSSPEMSCYIILLILSFIGYNFLGLKGLILSSSKNCSIWRRELKVWCQMASRDWKGLMSMFRRPMLSPGHIQNFPIYRQ